MRADAILLSSTWPSPMAHSPSPTGSSHLRLHPGPILFSQPNVTSEYHLLRIPLSAGLSDELIIAKGAVNNMPPR